MKRAHNGQQETEAMRKRRLRSPHPVIMVDGEPLVLGSRCHRCRPPKAILFGTLCYTHATGRPRTILRPDERAAGEEAA